MEATMNKVLGRGIIQKKGGWIVIVYYKPGDETPRITVKRVKEED